jgi:hypothetical protein
MRFVLLPKAHVPASLQERDAARNQDGGPGQVERQLRGGPGADRNPRIPNPGVSRQPRKWQAAAFVQEKRPYYCP